MSDLSLHAEARFRNRWPGNAKLSFLKVFGGRNTEQVIVLSSLYFALFFNQRFWSAWSASHDWSHPGTWMSAAIVAVLLMSIHCLILGVAVTRRTGKPVLIALFIASAVASSYMNRYTVFFDASMIRSVFHTDVKEALELVSIGMLGEVLAYSFFPVFVVMCVPIQARPWRRALLARGAFLLAAMAVTVIGVAVAFQDLSALMRNQKELRYLITPANFIVSSLRVLAAENGERITALIPVGADAIVAPAALANRKPRLLIVVVGETVRAANWGLNGYARQTTPKLAASDVINFPSVNSCGTNTEVSLPCMFSPFGRKSYDEKEIRRHESVLHVLDHAGIKTIWRDNQSGCKGVCNGLELQRPDARPDPKLCDSEHCMDAILLKGLESELKTHPKDMVIVLHQLGNHGPAYSRRHPQSFRQFTPTCDVADLGKCTREEIVNSYDNALLYTDYFLAATIRRLQSQHSHDAGMIYVSDHGESLGEKGIYLHGLPYAIAPNEQTQVPMVLWISDGFARSSAITRNCLKNQALKPFDHDYLFHTVLGFMQVKTSVYDANFDIAAGCRA